MELGMFVPIWMCGCAALDLDAAYQYICDTCVHAYSCVVHTILLSLYAHLPQRLPDSQ